MVIVVTDPMELEEKIEEARLNNAILVVEDVDALFKVHDADTVAEMLNGVQLYDKEEYDWVQKSKQTLREE